MTGEMLEKYAITNITMDLDELQGEPEFIAMNKIKLAS